MENHQLLEIKEKGEEADTTRPIARNPAKRDREGISIESGDKKVRYPQCQTQNIAESLKIDPNQIGTEPFQIAQNQPNVDWGGGLFPVREKG